MPIFVCSTPGCLRIDNTSPAGVLVTDTEPVCRICAGLPWFWIFGMKGLNPHRRYDEATDGPMDRYRHIKGRDYEPPSDEQREAA